MNLYAVIEKKDSTRYILEVPVRSIAQAENGIRLENFTQIEKSCMKAGVTLLRLFGRKEYAESCDELSTTEEEDREYRANITR